MTALGARRVEVRTLDDDVRASLRWRAAREGCLHASDALVVVGLGAARSIELPAGLLAPGVPARLGTALEEVGLEGDAGPGGSGVVAMGALPFAHDAPATLVIPRLVAAWHPGSDVTWLTETAAGDTTDPLATAVAAARDVAPLAPMPALLACETTSTDEGFGAALRDCIGRLRREELRKVVLARAATGRCTTPIDAATLAETLHGLDPSCDLYAYPAAEGRFVGASPELIVATSDGAVVAHPLAGTVQFARGLDDEAQVAWLLASKKNRAEHAVVVDDIVARLSPLCDAIHAADEPSVVRLSTNARLGTWIDGKLAGSRDAATAISALVALHPTPAVGGLPRDAALAVIEDVETTPRGPWAGPVGWVDADGTSSWTLGLRAVHAVDDRFTVWGGAGIVAASEPGDELEEIREKLASVLRVLGA